MSCLTWLRSIWCNSRCCVYWDPMNIDTMFIQVVYLSMCSWYCMLSITSRCFGQVDAFNSKRAYLCSIVGSAFSTPWPVIERWLVIDVLLLLGITNWCKCSRTLVLVTLHTLLNAIICCFQLNTGWGADANRTVDYLGIDDVGLTVYVLCCNAQ